MSFGELLIEQLDTVAGLHPSPLLRSDPDTEAGARARLAYVLDPKTGATVPTVAKMIGVRVETVRSWVRGTRSSAPTSASRRKIDYLYRRFHAINDRARREGQRRRLGKKVILAVHGNALRVENDSGDLRYWKPGHRWWPRFVARWQRSDAAGLDADWDEIVSDWDYPEPWTSDHIIGVDVV